MLRVLAVLGETSMMSGKTNITHLAASTTIIINNSCNPICPQ